MSIKTTALTPVRRQDVRHTPVSVCLLPLMDAAVQFSIMSAATVVGSKARPPIVTVDVNGTTDNHALTASYQMDMVNRQHPWSGVGLLGGKTSQTSSSLKDGAFEGTLTERIGRSVSALAFKVVSATKTMTVSGRLGTLPVRLEFRQQMDGGRVVGFSASGTLGADLFSVETRLYGVERKNSEGRPSHLEGQLQVRGMVGEHPIIKLYQLTSMGLPNGEELHFAGEGRVGEHHQILGVTLCITTDA